MMAVKISEDPMTHAHIVCEGCGCCVGNTEQAVAAHIRWHEAMTEAYNLANHADSMHTLLGGTP